MALYIDRKNTGANTTSPDAMELTENEIRPDHLKGGQVKRMAHDIALLLERRDEFVCVACPACDSSASTIRFEHYGLTFVDCIDCETMYINPRPGPAVLEWFYANSQHYDYFNRYIFPASEKIRYAKLFVPRAERLAEICERYGVPTETLLEAGAGFGTFCSAVRDLGLFRRIIAVEPTPALAETCRKKGIDVIEKPIEKVELDFESVDVVASFEVIDDLFSPREFVEGCARVLRPGGLLLLTCPNVKGFDVEILQLESTAIDWHSLNYFHPESLSRLVGDLGLTVIEVTTPGRLDAELVRKKALAGMIDLTNSPFLHHVLIDRWEELGDPFQRFLSEHGLSSHMWLVARKSA